MLIFKSNPRKLNLKSRTKLVEWFQQNVCQNVYSGWIFFSINLFLSNMTPIFSVLWTYTQVEFLKVETLIRFVNLLKFPFYLRGWHLSGIFRRQLVISRNFETKTERKSNINPSILSTILQISENSIIIPIRNLNFNWNYNIKRTDFQYKFPFNW
jgi:hypothetical protein